MNIANQRLHNQHLIQPLANAANVVAQLGAVQAQDFTGAKWALGLRAKTTDAEVTKLFNDGKVLRTHVLRPTWHFVAPRDILWLQQLTSPRVMAQSRYYLNKIGVDETAAAKANKVLAKALAGGKFLTRPQVGEVYKKAGFTNVSGLRFSYLIMCAELAGLVCSGPLVGKQHTYGLISERAPNAKILSRDKALLELTKRYFTSHGPAQIKDFMWWSSLTAADAKAGISAAKLKSIDVNGKTYFYAKSAPDVIDSPIAHFLPNYDEYFISYKDRSDFGKFKVLRQPSYQDLFYHILAIDGQLAGGWQRQIKRDEFIVKLNLFGKINALQQQAINSAVKKLSEFVGLPANLI